jgi:hypothetical protein
MGAVIPGRQAAGKILEAAVGRLSHMQQQDRIYSFEPAALAVVAAAGLRLSVSGPAGALSKVAVAGAGAGVADRVGHGETGEGQPGIGGAADRSDRAISSSR